VAIEILAEVPEQIVAVPDGVLSTGNGLTVIVTVPVICKLHVVVASVANTLKVVVLLKFPVGRLIVPPVPATGLPTLVLPELFLNW